MGYVQTDVSQTYSSDSSDRTSVRQRVLVALVGAAIVVACAWLTLVIITRIDELFLPGQGISLPGALSSLPGVEQAAGGPQNRINVLVMGLDRRPSEEGLPTRTDTIFVLTIDPQTKTAGILGIPRDLWVEIPYRDGSGFFEAKVNTAYVTGESQGYAGGGTALVKDVIQHNLGISIDHHVIIDFDAFIELIDELGGIDVYVSEPVYDPYYSHTEAPGDYLPLDFDVGTHHLNGTYALGYARTRYGSSDLDRIQRQQRVIFAALEKATELNLVDAGRMVDLWKQYKDTIETDINDLQVPGFASLAVKIDQDRITALSIGAATRPWMTNEAPPQSVLLFDPEMAQGIVEALFSDHQLLQEAALVEVQNGAGADGLASRAVDYLSGFGFPPDALTAATGAAGAVRPQTEIIDFSGKEYTVDRLASLLSVPPERVRRARADDGALRTTNADILVILGADSTARPFATESEASGG